MNEVTYAAKIVRVGEGHKGPYALCRCPELGNQSVTFSFSDYREEHVPQKGFDVLLHDVREREDGLRAHGAERLFIGRVIKVDGKVATARCEGRRDVQFRIDSEQWREASIPTERDRVEMTSVKMKEGQLWAGMAKFVRPPRRFK